MREIIKISVADTEPDRDEVLGLQGIPNDKKPSQNVVQIFEKSMELYRTCAQPMGIISEISIPAFEVVYAGEALNEERTPLDAIFRRADDLALFAVTIGETVIETIDRLFKSNEYALGSMLDAMASASAEKAADVLEKHFFDILERKAETNFSTTILRYSPGYCGWHVSAQKRLFAYLRPEDIGLTLLDSFLMRPLKSISGVLVAGKTEIHVFEDSYPFCRHCETHSCRERIRAIMDETRHRSGHRRV